MRLRKFDARLEEDAAAAEEEDEDDEGTWFSLHWKQPNHEFNRSMLFSKCSFEFLCPAKRPKERQKSNATSKVQCETAGVAKEDDKDNKVTWLSLHRKYASHECDRTMPFIENIRPTIYISLGFLFAYFLCNDIHRAWFLPRRWLSRVARRTFEITSLF